MEGIFPALQQYELGIYALLGVAALIYLQRLAVAWREWRGTIYGIERDIAIRRVRSASTGLLLMILFAVTEFMIVSFVIPSYPKTVALPTPTLNLLATPTVTQAPRMGALTSDRPTQTPTVEPTALPESCTPGQIEWIEPFAGQEISQTVRLVATVNIPNLGFYKYEFAEPGSDVWNTIAANNEPKVNGEIGFWNTSQLAAQEYLLRLVVVDNENNPLPVCVINVRVVEQ